MTQGKLKVWCVRLNATKTEFWLFRNRSGAERYVVRVLIPSILRLDLAADSITNKELLRKAAIQAGDEKRFVGFLREMVRAVEKNQFGRAIDIFKEYQTPLFLPNIVTIAQVNVL